MYEWMVTARYYEERLQEEYLEGKQPAFDISAGPIPGELHLAAGHESSAAGVVSHLRDSDTVTAPHRPHHVAIAKGVDLDRMTAEIFGRETGLGKGKGGHMHLFDPDVNFACSGIIAQGVPPAVGAALAAKKRNTDDIAVAFLGEGAIDQGAFLESLNLAKVQDLPVVFVIEDNDWAISMPKERITDVQDGSRRGEGHDIPHERVGHDDAVEVFEAAREAIGRARDDNGPSILEVQVHRRMGHFMGDAEAYRPEEDKEAAQMRDSIERLEATMEDAGITADERDSIRTDAQERVDDAIAWAKDQPEPEPDAAYEDVFTNPPSGVTDAEPATDGGETQ
ncbi:Pyruvate/2-oxoglutarate/acetoin dehydrogenase complex, dehydrogenase (E1) component, eukaryotic type, alpha subunit [Halanaeroarchaeum sp. HSR-CO]|uniref:thiamine pyrophosphate-dependent dehydrogenase E1 component subunit alpha n=1 Tax=Halanaeroarchaeum sp. HSR-CO TaxID=2866382 RepID=UPI0037BF1270|nr:Pyruvate/2-oxoglutarate/acetoin dehydrogenase complex, dehydrogenase (E1) component, eukaryotic type, alpha subunit [Halanaeroarchaeum sp. HSR-CO]